MISSSTIKFPQVYWRVWDCDVEFLPGSELPAESEGRIYAVVVFAFIGDQLLMAEIEGRGVCVPSGRVNPGETIDDAAVRETFEETGAHLHENHRRLIGFYRMARRNGCESGALSSRISYTACFIAEVTNFDPIPAGSESTGSFLLPAEDVPDHYFMWDDLLAAAFDYAGEERQRHFLSTEIGISTVNCDVGLNLP